MAKPWWLELGDRSFPRGATRTSIRRGSEHPNAKLTERKVWEMRQAHAAGWSYGKLARRFGVAEETVYHAVAPNGERWRHVTEEPPEEPEGMRVPSGPVLDVDGEEA